jgi:hypothetical protein
VKGGFGGVVSDLSATVISNGGVVPEHQLRNLQSEWMMDDDLSIIALEEVCLIAH